MRNWKVKTFSIIDSGISIIARNERKRRVKKSIYRNYGGLIKVPRPAHANVTTRMCLQQADLTTEALDKT